MRTIIIGLISVIGAWGCGGSYTPPVSDTSRPGIQDVQPDGSIGAGEMDNEDGTVPDSGADMDSKPPCVTIDWFLDYQDRFNRQFFDKTYPSLLENYADNVEFQYRHFPLPAHRNARQAAESAECARQQSAFLPYQSRLFERQRDWAESRKAAGLFREYAASLGLDENLFNNCLENRGAAPAVDADWREGVARGVVGVPAFFINDEYLMGAHSYDTFSEIIDCQLKECR